MDLVPWTKKLSINDFHFWLKLVYRHHVNQKCIKTFLPVFVMLNLVQPNSVYDHSHVRSIKEIDYVLNVTLDISDYLRLVSGWLQMK